MKEEMTRIMRLVAEGKLTPEDAAELMDAMEEARRPEEAESFEAAVPPASEPGANGTMPPPKVGVDAEPASKSFEDDAKAAFRSVVDHVERLARQAQDEAKKVDWKGVASEARENARKGFDSLRTGIEDVSKGKVNLGWILNDAAREVELPFTLTAAKALRIENECGDVRVVGGDAVSEVKASVRVRAENPEEAKRIAAEYTLAVEESDGEVRIRQPHAPGLSVRLHISIPEASLVEARADSGEIFVHDVRGAVKATSRTGRIEIGGSEGPVEAKSETGSIAIKAVAGGAFVESGTGDVTVEGVRGDLRVRASSGSVSARGLAAGVVEAETVSGSVFLSFAEPPSSVSASTVSGRIGTSVPEGGAYVVELSTLRGEARCDLPLVDANRAAQRITGRIGEGGPTVKLASVSGGVDLRLAPTPGA